ncbi:MAG TPA: hypothetical protein VFV90_08085, partial [Usitatibacter sp.]|nr:hypothetical protein [Usitatibacter sp.]
MFKNRTKKSFALSLGTLIIAVVAMASMQASSNPVHVKEVTTYGSPLSGFPAWLTDVGGTLFFTAIE